MKKYIITIIPLILISVMFLSGCSLGEMNRENELKSSLESTYEELTSTFSGDSGQYSLVSEYLKSWAKKNSIERADSGSSDTILSNPATTGYENSEPTVLQCSIRTDDFRNSMQSLAISLTSLLGPEIHGNISLIVTEVDNGEFTGASAADPKYYSSGSFINIDNSDDIELVRAGSYEMDSTMTASLSTSASSYTHAYTITMSISGYHDPFSFENHYPNPVETIGSLLATEKSSGKLFDLASFECESADGYTPTSATAVVVVNDNDVNSFTSKFEKSYNSIKNRFEKLGDNFVYTLTETSLPESVISSDSSNNIISLMYTLQSGIYLQDEDTGEIISASDISYVSTSGGTFTLKMRSRSTDKATLSDMSAEFLTTSGLSDISYSVTDPHMTWSSDSKNDASAFLADALGTKDSITENTLESSDLDVFASKADINAVSYRCSLTHREAALMNLLHYTESLVQ